MTFKTILPTRHAQQDEEDEGTQANMQNKSVHKTENMNNVQKCKIYGEALIPALNFAFDCLV